MLQALSAEELHALKIFKRKVKEGQIDRVQVIDSPASQLLPRPSSTFLGLRIAHRATHSP